jgi:hypothetical protein
LSELKGNRFTRYFALLLDALRSADPKPSSVSPVLDAAARLFLHPAVAGSIHEHVVIQNHPITFATIDLSGRAAGIRSELRGILLGA